MRALGLPPPAREFRFCERRWRFDFAWPSVLVACEVEGLTGGAGGRHQRRQGYKEDLEKYARAWELGWRVLRVDYSMVKSGRAIELLRPHLGADLERDG